VIPIAAAVAIAVAAGILLVSGRVTARMRARATTPELRGAGS